MRGRRKAALWLGAAVFSTCVQSKACHVSIHYTKAEIEAANVRLYERDVYERDRDITGFDRKHGMLGELLGNQQFFEQEFQAWKSHPGRFEHEHHKLWRVLDGEWLYNKRHGIEPSVVNAPPELLHSGGSVPTPDGQPGGGDSGFSVHTSAVPEPSSGVLGLTALIAGLSAWAGRSRCLTRLTFWARPWRVT
jgi:hypothetical protein